MRNYITMKPPSNQQKKNEIEQWETLSGGKMDREELPSWSGVGGEYGCKDFIQ